MTTETPINKGHSPRTRGRNAPAPAIVWFSCGATSAVATKLAAEKFRELRIIYIDTGAEHPDNKRFLRECEKWLHHDIEIRKSERFHNPIEVFHSRKFLNSPYGAPCTLELKKKVRWRIEDELTEWSAQIFGFDASERKRFDRFREQYPNAKAEAPLIDKSLSKEDCLAILIKAGIEIPKMYRLGFHNNNCIGCVKGGRGYWSHIRRHFPEVFEEMAKLERTLGHSCISDCYLDELPEYDLPPIVPSCSLFCDPDFMDI